MDGKCQHLELHAQHWLRLKLAQISYILSLMKQGERWERYDDKWRKGRTGKFTTPNELVSPTFPAKAESLKWWWTWLVVVIRQHYRLNICSRYIGWVEKYWYLPVSEAKIQITLLIVTRGAWPIVNAIIRFYVDNPREHHLKKILIWWLFPQNRFVPLSQQTTQFRLCVLAFEGWTPSTCFWWGDENWRCLWEDEYWIYFTSLEIDIR